MHARACAAGGWIPASQRVVEEPKFQAYLEQQPMFRTFVELAGSPDQVPIPPVPVAAFYQSEVIRAAEEAMYLGRDPETVLKRAAADVRQQLAATKDGR